MSRTDAHTPLKHLDPYYDHEWTFHKPLTRAGIDTIGSGKYWRALDRLLHDAGESGGFRQIGTLTVFFQVFPHGISKKLADDDILFGEVYDNGRRDDSHPGEIGVIRATDLHFDWAKDAGLTGVDIDAYRNTAENAFRFTVHRHCHTAGYSFNFGARRRGKRLPSFIIPDGQTGRGIALVNRGEKGPDVLSLRGFYLLTDRDTYSVDFAIIEGPATRGGEEPREEPPYHMEASPFSFEEERKHYSRHRDDWYGHTDPGRNSSRMENGEAKKLYNADPAALNDM